MDGVRLGRRSRRICFWIAAVCSRKPAAFFLAGLALGRVLGLADRLRDLVGLAVELFELDLQGFAPFLEAHEAIDVDRHVPAAQFCLTVSAFSTMNLRSSMVVVWSCE